MLDQGERELFAGAVRDAIAKHQSSEGDDAPVDAVLDALGWREVLADDPSAALACVVRAVGAANATSTLLDDVLAYTLGIESAVDVAVVLPRFGGWEAPGRIDEAGSVVDGLGTARVARPGRVFVVAGGAGSVHLIELDPSAVATTPVAGIDPAYGMHTVRAELVAAGTRLDAARWDAAVALGSRSVAHETAGALRTMLDLARQHALERVQFDRPIARFQAVRHRLAEALVAIEALDATLDAADDGTPITASLAKATAARAARMVSAHCQQVLAGIGFTTDHPFHRSLKRVTLLSGLFGSEDALTHSIGVGLIRDRHVPTLVEL